MFHRFQLKRRIFRIKLLTMLFKMTYSYANIDSMHVVVLLAADNLQHGNIEIHHFIYMIYMCWYLMVL